MKKTLAMTIVLTILLSLFTVVNAATTVTAPATAKKGDTITVTIDFGTTVNTGDIKLKYDKSVLEFVEDSAKPSSQQMVILSPEDGTVLNWSYLKGSQTITVEFKVLVDQGETTVEVAPYGEGLFVDDETNTTVPAEGIVAGTSQKVVIGEVTEPTDPTNPTDPTDPTNPTDPDEGKTDPTTPTNPDNNNGDEVSTDEKAPNKDKQTGVNALAVVLPAVALLTLAGVVISKKN